MIHLQSDELNIQLGDKVTILAEYDDGWVLGVNETRGGIKGVFPKNCGNESNNESIDTESDIDPDDYEYYDNHNRDIDFLIEDYIDLNNSLFNYEGSDKNKIDISVENLHHNENYEYNPNDLVSNVFAMMYERRFIVHMISNIKDVLKRKTGVSDKLFHHVLAIKATLGGINPSYLTS
ncbi:5290_t:CDS:2 [Entrophospora sp. SA101]|nr:5290_t:CDS:2 [Entrophospora sp. SA101]